MGKSLTTPLEDATMHEFLNVIILTHLTTMIAPDSKSNATGSHDNAFILDGHVSDNIPSSHNNDSMVNSRVDDGIPNTCVNDNITNCHANNDITDSQNNGNVGQTKQTCQ